MKRGIFKSPAAFGRLTSLFGIAALATVISLGLLGCQTTVPVSYTEPARLDLSGVDRIAIDAEDSQIIASLSQKITESGKYTVASEQELREWKQWKAERQAMAELAAYQGQATEISAANLVGEYARNTARADSAYLGKVLKISALVKEIGSSGDRYFVRLEGAGNDSVDVFFDPLEESRIASVDKDQTITVIGECNGFKRPDLQDTAEILRLLGAGRSINIINATFPVEGLTGYPGAVDAVIILNTTIASVQDDSRVENRAVGKDANGNTVYQDVTVYIRAVTVNLDFQIENTRDGSLIAQGTKSARGGDSATGGFPAADNIAASTSRGTPLDEFAAEIVPTQRYISLTLAKESENKEAKKEMGDAEKLAKAKNYADAAAAYGRIYASYSNFAAGYNQAVLTEIATGSKEAIELMEALLKETDNAMAQSALEGMQQRNTANQSAAAQ
jgi:hypothetical protein